MVTYFDFLSAYKGYLINEFAFVDSTFDVPEEGFANALKYDATLTRSDRKVIKAILNKKTSRNVRKKINENDYFKDYTDEYVISKMYSKFHSKISGGIGRDIILSGFLYDVNIKLGKLLKDSVVRRMNATVNDELVKEVLIGENAKLKKQIQVVSKENPVLKRVTSVNTVLNDFIIRYKGKAIYIDFWATWCGPCMEQLRNSVSKKKPFEERGVVFLYLNIDYSEKAWKNAVTINNIKGEHFLLSRDQFNYLSKEFNITGIPHYIGVDTSGRIFNVNVPNPTVPEFNSFITKLLE